MGVEQELLTKVLAANSIQRLAEKKVKDTMFADLRAEYVMIVNHYREYGEMPGIEAIRRYFPNFQPVAAVPEPLDYYIDELRKKRKYSVLADALRESGRQLGENTDQAMDTLENALRTIYTEIAEMRDVSWTDRTGERREEYEHRESLRGVFGILTPWRHLNDLTMGFAPENLITIAGRPKRGKTWVMVLIALMAIRQNKKVLFVTLEMSPAEIERRADAAWGRFGYEEFRKAMMGTEPKNRYFEVLQQISELDTQFIITGDADAKGQVGTTFLDAKIRQYNPDILMIDGVYLMHDEIGHKSRTEKMYNLTQGLKRTARHFQIPIAVTAQMKQGNENREAGQSGVQWSDSFAQDSDMLIEIFQTKEMREQRFTRIILQTQREGNIGHLDVNWNLDTMDFGESAREDGDDGNVPGRRLTPTTQF